MSKQKFESLAARLDFTKPPDVGNLILELSPINQKFWNCQEKLSS